MKKKKKNKIKLMEAMIGTVAANIRVTMAIQKTNHATDRQTRHQDDFISDRQIKSGIEDAVNAIAKNLMVDKIQINDYICIINHKFKPPLNIVGNIKSRGNQLQFVVVTIMKKNNFIPKGGTHRLQIK